jgi:hypothetical protein
MILSQLLMILMIDYLNTQENHLQVMGVEEKKNRGKNLLRHLNK